jgi:uroporphyrinogen III methyltransferase/synthase
MVYLVGVGPGDYKLLTLKALECIEKADVIIYDRLISKKILNFAKVDSEFIFVGKESKNHTVSQSKINELLIKKSKEGKTVARLKGGDPFVFGRGAEEAEILSDNNIDFEIVHGISSVVAVPGYSGIPLTHRNFASSFHVITGHERPDKDESDIDYETISKLRGTLIFLMGIKNLSKIVNNLIKNGMDKEIPVAIIENGTTDNQRVIKGILSNIIVLANENKVKSPGIIVVGKVVNLADKISWFNKGILSGKKVIVTRAREIKSQLTENLELLGASVIEFPVIKIEEPDSYDLVDEVLNNLNKFDWIVFTSRNGVKEFFKRLKLLKIDIRNLLNKKFAVVGSGTKEELEKFNIYADLIPEKFTTDDLLKDMIKKINNTDKILLARSDIGNKELREGLIKEGFNTKEIIIYKTSIEKNDKKIVIDLLLKNEIDYITFTSSSTVTNFIKIIGSENIELINNTNVICIGPVTKKTCENNLIKVKKMAKEYTINGVVDEVLNNEIKKEVD